MLSIIASKLDFGGAIGKKAVFGIRVVSSIYLRHIRRVRVRPIRKIWMVPPTRVISIGIWVIGRPRVEVINIIDFIIILGKKDSQLGNLKSNDQWNHKFHMGEGH